MAPLVLMVAPNGARRSKADHPGLPMTPDELAAEAERCCAAGATVIHLHVRTADGRHSLDPDLYRSAMRAIRSAVGERMAIQVTTEAAGVYMAEAQRAVVRELRPEAVSLAIRELIPDEASIEQAAALRPLAALISALRRNNILYTADEVARFHELRRRGVIPQSHPWVLFVLGRHAEATAIRASDLVPLLRHHEDGVPWSVCAFGPAEAAAALAAAGLGGHVRVGFENNLWLRDGSLAGSNADLVVQTRRELPLVDRSLADIEWTRGFLARTAA
ncbi:MAG: 3-keto-5-aminohexanoate cleavage protein [Rhizobiales bacterium]|nr:3-keto-5-aminohexanoate cleavage protein [Hyphomicrobiales bacterium]